MRPITRLAGSFFWLVILAGCGARGYPTAPDQGAPTIGAHEARCRAGGAECRWDGQCCSGRCYVDTGCSG
jgi:hypothetical protein